MYIKSFNSQYDLAEFNHCVNEVDGECVCILELLIEGDLDSFKESDFEGPLLIGTDKQCYVFTDFKVSEYFGEHGLVRVICVK